MRIIAVVLCLCCFVSCSYIGGEEEMTPSLSATETDAETWNWLPVWRDNITIAGHHLEWMALAAPLYRPAKDCITKAVASVADQIGQLPPLQHRSFKTILPCSHAAKAMCLMRNAEPYQIWLTLSNASKEGKE